MPLSRRCLAPAQSSYTGQDNTGCQALGPTAPACGSGNGGRSWTGIERLWDEHTRQMGFDEPRPNATPPTIILPMCPDSAVLNAAREVASSAFRVTNPLHLDLRYGKTGAQHLGPVSHNLTRDAPCIVFIHGGYWQRNAKEQFANLIAGPHARGWSAALPGYTLAPDASLTEIVAEINAALDWLGGARPGARDQRPDRAVRLVGGRPSDGDVPGPSPGEGRPRDLRNLRARARCATPI